MRPSSKYFLILSSFISFQACTHSRPVSELNQVQVTEEKNEAYQRAYDLYLAGEQEKAIQEVDLGLKLNRFAAWTEAAQLLKAQIFISQQDLLGAEAILVGVRDRQIGQNLRLATQAEWLLAHIAQEKGDFEGAYIKLQGVLRRSQDLSPEVRLAELPVRLGYICYRLGRTDEAEQWIRSAESGIEILKNTPQPLERNWPARLYFEMGASSAPTFEAGDFERILVSQKLSQKYLFRAIEMNHPIWSQRAAFLLAQKLDTMWTYLVNQKPLPDLDQRAQAAQCAGLMDALDEVRIRVMPENVPVSLYEKEAQKAVDVVYAKAQKCSYSLSNVLMLTNESKKLNALKRGGEPSLKAPKSKDPN